MEHYANTTNRKPFDISQVDKRMVLPSIANFQSEDSIFGETKTNIGEQTGAIQKGKKVSYDLTGLKMNVTEITAPFSGKNTHKVT